MENITFAKLPIYCLSSQALEMRHGAEVMDVASSLLEDSQSSTRILISLGSAAEQDPAWPH